MIRTLLLFLILFLSPAAVFAHSDTQIIEMTSNGFLPQEVTVDDNSSIIFLNKDSKPRWPASNVHPTHDLYPEFDPQKPIAPGESWVFKPKKKGVWKYHDHLLPHFRGSISVVSEIGKKEQDLIKESVSIQEQIKNVISGYLDKLKKLFRLEKEIKLPLKEEFSKLNSNQQIDTLKKLKAQLAWQFVKETFKDQGGSSGNIHDLAHLSGALIYQQEGFEGLGNCSSEFAFGCYHGFLDSAFAKDLDHLLDAQNACSKLGPSGSGPVASCIHGIGHGVASFYSSSDIKKALSSCRKLTLGEEFCFDGVFMEIVRSAPDSFFKKDDPLYPCNSLEKEFGYAYSFACGRNQPSLLMSKFKLGFDEVVNICLNSSSKPFQQACFDSLGFSLASTQDVEKIITSCQGIIRSEFVIRCIKSAAGELIFQEVPGWDEKSRAVCQSLLENKGECINYINQLISDYHRVKKINFLPKNPNEDLNTYIREQLKKCYGTGGVGGCYKDVAKIFYDQFGLPQTLKYLKENENYLEVYARCHEVTHYLSRSEYEKQKNIAKVYAQCDSTCHGGCYHGTMEAYLKENSSSDFAKICGKAEDYQKPIEFNECLHGLGHAAMFITDMELKHSLKMCDLISRQEHKERCYSGVFMENSSSSTSFDHASVYIKADDPLYPCNDLEEKYLPLCWQYQSSYFSIINKQDWQKVADLCLKVPKTYQDQCFRTVGTNQVGFTQDLSLMKKDCELMPTEQFQDICVLGVVSSLAYRFVGDMDKMIQFCDLVDKNHKETCFKQIGAGLLDWSTDKNLAIKNCQKIKDPQNESWCRSVI